MEDKPLAILNCRRASVLPQIRGKIVLGKRGPKRRGERHSGTKHAKQRTLRNRIRRRRPAVRFLHESKSHVEPWHLPRYDPRGKVYGNEECPSRCLVARYRRSSEVERRGRNAQWRRAREERDQANEERHQYRHDHQREAYLPSDPVAAVNGGGFARHDRHPSVHLDIVLREPIRLPWQRARRQTMSRLERRSRGAYRCGNVWPSQMLQILFKRHPSVRRGS